MCLHKIFYTTLIDTGYRPYRLKNINIFISETTSYRLLEKLINKGFVDVEYENNQRMLYNHVSERNPFGFSTTTKLNTNEFKGAIKIYASKGKLGYCLPGDIKRNSTIIDCYKVLTAFANNIGTDLADDNLNTIIASPGSICTETYLVVGADLQLNEKSAINLSNYLKTKFVRFLISLAKANQNGTRKTYRFVPLQDFTSHSDIDWSQSIAELDAQLYRKYGLSEDEIAFVESKVKEMG